MNPIYGLARTYFGNTPSVPVHTKLNNLISQFARKRFYSDGYVHSWVDNWSAWMNFCVGGGAVLGAPLGAYACVVESIEKKQYVALPVYAGLGVIGGSLWGAASGFAVGIGTPFVIAGSPFIAFHYLSKGKGNNESQNE